MSRTTLVQAQEVLSVRKEQYHYGVGELPRADARNVGMTGARVDQDVVRIDEFAPLFLKIFEQEIAVVLLVESSPIDLSKRARVAVLARSRRHDPKGTVGGSDVGRLKDEFAHVGSVSGAEIRVHEVDHAGRGAGLARELVPVRKLATCLMGLN